MAWLVVNKFVWEPSSHRIAACRALYAGRQSSRKITDPHARIEACLDTPPAVAVSTLLCVVY